MVVGRGSLRRFSYTAPVLGIAVTLGIAGCSGDSASSGVGQEESVSSRRLSVSTPASAFPATFARQWMVNLANSVKGDGVSPPVAARTYAYGAIALYESVVHGMPGYRSLAGQLNGLSSLPQPDGGLDYDWPSVMAATMSRLVVEPGPTGRSEERRVGKECRSRWSPYH